MIPIIIPVYNEEDRLNNVLHNIINKLEKNPRHDIFFSDDNSTDNTALIISKFCSASKKIKLFKNKERLGKGATISKAIEKSDNDFIIFMDLDMATDINFLSDLTKELSNGHDIVVGSRYLDSSNIKRKPLRNYASLVYNKIVKLLFSSTINDHQCGFKAFRRDSVLYLLPHIKATHWFWDTELLVKAQRAGLRVKEIPISWEEKDGGKFNLAKGSTEIFFDLIKLFVEINIKGDWKNGNRNDKRKK